MTDETGALRIDSFGANGDGTHDDGAAIQAAIDACADQGGGTVFAPPGTYRVNGTLNVREKVSLRGAGGAIDGWGMPTSLHAFSYESEFITLEAGAGVQNLDVFYPEQVLEAGKVRAYPYTIKAPVDDCHVIGVSLRNSYNGIDLDRSARHLIRDVHGSPLNIGIYVDRCYDIGRIENVHFWPFMGPEKHRAFYFDYMPQVATAFVFGRTDWQYVLNTFCWGYKIGYHFAETEHGSCNGNFQGIGADAAVYSVVVDQVQHGGLLISNGEFVAMESGDSAALVVNETNTGHVSLDNCAVWGPSHQVARIAGTGSVNIASCTFVHNDKNEVDAPAIECTGGSLSVSSSHFRMPMNKAMTAPQVAIREGTESAVVFGNMCEGPWRAANEIGDRAEIGMNVGT